MSKPQKIWAVVLLILMAGLGVAIIQLKAHQRLGEPGIKTQPISGSERLEVMLPETLPGYDSEIITNAEKALLVLPDDTSFRVRAYRSDTGFSSEMSVVLMGNDRSSIHDPSICMPGQGWVIDKAQTGVDHVSMDKPFSYDLPVNKMLVTKVFKDTEGKSQAIRGIFLYWFVDDDHYTESPWKWKILWLPQDLLLKGVLDRWAYVSCFSVCAPGQEAATLENMKKFIALSVPQFQLVPQATSMR